MGIIVDLKLTKAQIAEAERAGQSIIESVYTAINQVWNDYLKQDGTYTLLYNPYKNLQTWTNDTRQRYGQLEAILGPALLCIAMYSREFSRDVLIGSGKKDSDRKSYRDWVVVDRLAQNRDSLAAFATIRSALNVDWFAHYNASGLGTVSDPLLNRLPGLEANHHFEVYLASDGTVKRSTFENSLKTTRQMDNIKENIWNKRNFTKWKAPKPAQWPPGHPYPSNPVSLIKHDGNLSDGNWAACYNCHKWTGIFSNSCKCKPTEEALHPCVEIKQYQYPGGKNRGVRAVSFIPKKTMMGEYNGEFVPVDHAHLPPWGEADYSLEWEAPPHLDKNGWALDDQKDIEAIASLVGGRKGSWAKFINHRPLGQENVRFWPVPFGGRYRIIVETTKAINFGDEVVAFYGNSYWKEN